MSMTNNKIRTYIYLLIVFLISILSFYLIDLLVKNRLPDDAVNIVVGLVGASLTFVLTAIVVNAKFKSSGKHDHAYILFEKRLEMYSAFLELVINGSESKEGIDTKSIKQLTLRMSLICEEDLLQEIVFFLQKIMEFPELSWGKLDEKTKLRWYEKAESTFFDGYKRPNLDNGEETERLYYALGDVILTMLVELEVDGKNTLEKNINLVDILYRQIVDLDISAKRIGNYESKNRYVNEVYESMDKNTLITLQ